MMALVALLVAGGLGNAHGVVLCLAADGHVEIESEPEKCCSGLLSARSGSRELAARELVDAPGNSSHCGPCVDIPIGIGDPTIQKNLILQNSPSPVKPLAAVASGYTFGPSEASLGQSAPTVRRADDGTLSSLRTTVLLI